MPEGKGVFWVDVDIPDVAPGDAEILSMLNPEGADVIITKALFRTVEAGAALTDVNVGVGPANDGDYNNVFGAQRVDQEGIVGTANLAQLWEDGEFLTITKDAGAAGSEVGIVGRLFVEYIRA